MKKIVRFVQVVAFGLVAGVWLIAFTASMTGAVAMYFGHNLFTPEMQGTTMLLTILTQFSWGLVVGSYAHARGWNGAIGSKFTNWLSLTLIHGLIAMPASVVLAGWEFHKTGKFVPAPHEC